MVDTGDIDQHKHANLSKVEFHGTLITLQRKTKVSSENEPLDMTEWDQSKKSQIPDFYANVPQANLADNTDIVLRKTEKPVRPS